MHGVQKTKQLSFPNFGGLQCFRCNRDPLPGRFVCHPDWGVQARKLRSILFLFIALQIFLEGFQAGAKVTSNFTNFTSTKKDNFDHKQDEQFR